MSVAGTSDAVGAWPLSNAMPAIGALATAPALARAYVRTVLTTWCLPDLTETVELVVSELSANAVAASADGSGRPEYAGEKMPVIGVRLCTDGSRVRVEIWDQAPGVPILGHPAPDAECGRGLALIDAMTGGRWGWHPAAAGPGKCVWAEISLSGWERY